MARYQINLLVDIEAEDDDTAHEIAENVADFLGMHYQTTTSGLVKELLIVDEEADDEYVDPYDELMTDEDVDHLYAGA